MCPVCIRRFERFVSVGAALWAGPTQGSDRSGGIRNLNVPAHIVNVTYCVSVLLHGFDVSVLSASAHSKTGFGIELSLIHI